MEDETKFHWAEGMKYALEGIKTLFVLNGAATVSILTFIGNTGTKPGQLAIAMASFALGAATGPIALWLAYLTQLQYGNSTRNGSASVDHWSRAVRFHNGVYWAVGFGLVLFLAGVFVAGFALLT